jgi:hypothetical protein
MIKSLFHYFDSRFPEAPQIRAWYPFHILSQEPQKGNVIFYTEFAKKDCPIRRKIPTPDELTKRLFHHKISLMYYAYQTIFGGFYEKDEDHLHHRPCQRK